MSGFCKQSFGQKSFEDNARLFAGRYEVTQPSATNVHFAQLPRSNPIPSTMFISGAVSRYTGKNAGLQGDFRGEPNGVIWTQMNMTVKDFIELNGGSLMDSRALTKLQTDHIDWSIPRDGESKNPTGQSGAMLGKKPLRMDYPIVPNFASGISKDGFRSRPLYQNKRRPMDGMSQSYFATN